MNRLIYFLALFFIISQPLFAQESGVPRAVDVSNRQTTLTLDFSTHDYELILYSLKMGETDHERTFNFVVTGNFWRVQTPGVSRRQTCTPGIAYRPRPTGISASAIRLRNCTPPATNRGI